MLMDKDMADKIYGPVGVCNVCQQQIESCYCRDCDEDAENGHLKTCLKYEHDRHSIQRKDDPEPAVLQMNRNYARIGDPVKRY